MKLQLGSLWLLCLSVISARARDTKTTSTKTTSTKTTSTNEFYSTSFSTLSTDPSSRLTGSQYSYASVTGQRTVTTAVSSALNVSRITRSSDTATVTYIGGTRTRSAPTASNTVACNGWPEFCDRQYSNITYVCAHNSAFVVPNNAASNQLLPVTDQLDDGIRMIQGETHWYNGSIQNCHTSCLLLDAGPWEAELKTVKEWLDRNPYEVVTWLIVNSDFVPVERYVPAIQRSGIMEYLYEPQYVPQHRDQWPTIGEMILSGKRLVMFMDYNANQSAVPYILDEFTHMWETPFSPVDPAFPCTQQRPPGLSPEKARDEFMYLANHNLNTVVDLSALGDFTSQQIILIPNTAQINRTNGDFDRFGQLGETSKKCTHDWGRPPNFLLVDYYNLGRPRPGSVFEVAARANGVTYDWKCCGLQQSAAPMTNMAVGVLAIALAFTGLWVW